MHLVEGEIYHVYNRGNNKQRIFIKKENYTYFLGKIELYIKPVCDILAWCLMPNHFHLLIHANAHSVPIIKDGSFERQNFSQAVKQLLSSYTKAINKQEGRTGSLFQQKTKAVHVNGNGHHPYIAFHYIHQNPLKAGKVKRMEDWEYSSFQDYINMERTSICSREKAVELIDLNLKELYQESYQVMNLNSGEVSYTLKV